MSPHASLAAERAALPHLTPVRQGDPALVTTLLLNAARRGFARLAAMAVPEAEPDWPSFLRTLVEAGALPVDTLACPGTHAAVPVLAAAVPALDRAVVSHEYGRAFAGELAAHEAAYLAHLEGAGLPCPLREALLARLRHETLLRDLEALIACR